VTLSEYLATSYRPDCEYLDGELLERNVGEWDHSRLLTLLSRYLSMREKQWGILVVVEQRVQVKIARFRVPDISVLTGPPPDGGIIVEPPYLCIEILSPSDRRLSQLRRPLCLAAASAHAARVCVHGGRSTGSERRHAPDGRSRHMRASG
jgi:Uma2 family endonuclease